jgi:hypothetical protein
MPKETAAFAIVKFPCFKFGKSGFVKNTYTSGLGFLIDQNPRVS